MCKINLWAGKQIAYYIYNRHLQILKRTKF